MGRTWIFFSVKAGGTYSNHWALKRHGGKSGYNAIGQGILDDKGRVRCNQMLRAVLFKRAEMRTLEATCLMYTKRADEAVSVIATVRGCGISNLEAPCFLYIGQAFRFSPESAFYIFNQQIYFIIWYLLDRASLI